MSINADCSLFGLATTVISGTVLQVTGNAEGPWWLGIAAAIGGFVLLVSRWIMARWEAMQARQDKMHDENRQDAVKREERWQLREAERTEIHQTQILTLQSISHHLTILGNQVDEVLKRVVDEFEDRKRP